MKCLAAAISSTVTTQGCDSNLLVVLILAAFCPSVTLSESGMNKGKQSDPVKLLPSPNQ